MKRQKHSFAQNFNFIAIMKILFAAIIVCLSLSSCATIFTSQRQSITFSGLQGTKLYEASSNMKIGEIGDDKTTTIRIKKKTGEKNLLAKKDGYKTTPLMLETSFNTTSLWNLLFWPGFIVDFATGQINKYDNTYVEVEMEKVDE